MPDRSNLDRRAFMLAASAFSMLPLASAVHAQDAGDIARRMNTVELTQAVRATSRVEIRRAGSETRVRDLEIAIARKGGEELSLRHYKFLSPADVRGTELLIHENAQADNDIWLLLPAVSRARRITASNLSGSFAGTDFAFADLMAMQLHEYDHMIVSASGSSLVLDSTVRTASYTRSVGYSRLLTTLDPRSAIPSRVDYFDPSGQHVKTQTIGRAARTPDGRHILRQRHMAVLGTGRETMLTLSDLNFASGLSANDFSPQRLGR